VSDHSVVYSLLNICHKVTDFNFLQVTLVTVGKKAHKRRITIPICWVTLGRCSNPELLRLCFFSLYALIASSEFGERSYEFQFVKFEYSHLFLFYFDRCSHRKPNVKHLLATAALKYCLGHSGESSRTVIYCHEVNGNELTSESRVIASLLLN